MKTLVGCASLAAVLAAVLLLLGGGHASTPFAVAVANAATRCPDGFTVTVHGLPAGSEPTSSLSDTCVLSLGIPAGATGATGPTGPAGAVGPAGPTGAAGIAVSDPGCPDPCKPTHTTKRVSSNTGEAIVATAKCPAGKTAVGGGASATTVKGSKSNSDNRWAITTTQPTPDGNGWTAVATINTTKSNTFRVLPPPPGSLKVTAICAVVTR